MAGRAFSSPEWYRNLKDTDVSTDIGRLTIYHLGFKQAADGTLVFPPLDFSTTPRAVLDVGTADGLWMRDVQSSMAMPLHGTHTFTGTDLNPLFFPSTTPPHMTFVKQDINAILPSSWQSSFDLVHLRMILIAAGSGEKQRAVVNEHVKLVKPGGWIQIGGCDRVCPTPEELRRKGIEADLIVARAFAGAAKALDQSIKPLPDTRLDTLEPGLEKELNEVGAFFPMRFVWGRKPR